MNIIFICNEYPPYVRVGGIGVFTHTIAHEMVGSGHNVTVLAFGKISREWNDSGVRVVILSESSTRGVAWIVNRLRLYYWLKKEVRSGFIDIIELPEYQGMLPFKFPWCQIVVRLHTSFLAEQKIQRILERRTLDIHRNWIAVSDWIGQETIRKFRLEPSNMAVIYNSITSSTHDVEVPFKLPDNYVLYVGTIRAEKGAFVLAKAARSFLASNPDLHLVYVGGLTIENGKRADETILEILGKHFTERVHFTGCLGHDLVLACMKKAKVFAFPSKLEAFSLVPLEAMSCNVPVVYSKLHSGPEAIDDGTTGLLADPYNADDVADKVMRLLNDEPFAAWLSKNAKQVVKERFSPKRCVDGTIDFYISCLTHKGKSK